jgi:hypothetical protein
MTEMFAARWTHWTQTGRCEVVCVPASTASIGRGYRGFNYSQLSILESGMGASNGRAGRVDADRRSVLPGQGAAPASRARRPLKKARISAPRRLQVIGRGPNSPDTSAACVSAAQLRTGIRTVRDAFPAHAAVRALEHGGGRMTRRRQNNATEATTAPTSPGVALVERTAHPGNDQVALTEAGRQVVEQVARVGGSQALILVLTISMPSPTEATSTAPRFWHASKLTLR